MIANVDNNDKKEKLCNKYHNEGGKKKQGSIICKIKTRLKKKQGLGTKI